MKNSDYIVIDTNNCEVPKEGSSIYESRKNVVELSNMNNKALVSILVIAYNRIEKTKNCIESILRYTNDVNYELVLVDNGSDDGTLDYFKSIKYDNKKIIHITKNLQLAFGILQGTKYCNGMYIAFLNNDMIVTHNWLSNIMKCFYSDERIGMVCTTSSNISNLQDANIRFSSIEEMQEKAKLFNVSDPRKWHERLRLITSGAVYKRECIEICGNWDYGFFHDFSDDDLTFHIRRAGYKTILCKDVFVHHNHDFSAMDNEASLRYQKSLEKGRENFKNKYFGIDAWDDTNNFELNMIEMLNRPVHNSINVLGIDVKCGTPILEVKNALREHDVFDTCLSSFTEDAKYYIDLKTVCEGLVFCDRIDYISEYYVEGSFDYILLGKSLNLYSEPFKVLTDILKLLNKNGQAILKLRNTNDIRCISSLFGNVQDFDNEYPVSWTIESFVDWISKLGYRLEKVVLEQHNMTSDYQNVIKQFCEQNNINQNSYNRLITKDYIVSIVKND